MEDDRYLVAGQLFHFTSGSYSDYSLQGDFVALKDLSLEAAEEIASGIRARVEAAEKTTGWHEGDVHDEFQAALIRGGYLLAVVSNERHIGDYGELVLS